MKADAQRLAQTMAAIKTQADPKAWAHALRKREMMGDRLSLFQRQCWRAALAEDQKEAA